MDIGFIGLGRMGTAMALNLVKAGHRVRAWNRSEGEAIDGVERVSSPDDAFQAEAVFTMLSDDAAIREVLLDGGVLARARHGVVHVATSTISVDFAGELAAIHARAGLGYVSAPVLGRPDVAAKGELNILAAGKADAMAKVRPLLAVLGRKTWVMGEDPKQANAAKIACNMMITMAIEAMAEAVVLTKSNGVAPEAFFDLILNTLFGARAYETYSQNIVMGQYEPGFRMQLGLKDLRLATAVAEKAGRRLPQLDAVRTLMSEAVDAGLGDKDWSGIADYTLHHGGAER